MNHSKQNLKLLKINEYYIYKYIYILYYLFFRFSLDPIKSILYIDYSNFVYLEYNFIY